MVTSAERAWTLMQEFVSANSRHRQLAETLGFSLGGGRGKALVRLGEQPCTLSQLGQVIGADAPYTTLIVDKLEASGLVRRDPDPADRRRKVVTLTAAGQTALATARGILDQVPAPLLSLRKRDAQQLSELLARLLDRPPTPPVPSSQARR